ncbi:MAG: putative glutamine amidotransferase [Parasphingorhabdus sp.]|jgi:predicted glutamine amidotransferase
MCRLLLVRNVEAMSPLPYLKAFQQVARDSNEYQGHGWGCCWLDSQNNWQFHHTIRPVWEDDRDDFPDTRLFLAHARSAFRDEGIQVENNMPFTDGHRVFLFNGELRGVKVKAEGRIGAEKLFNYVKRFDKGDFAAAVNKGVEVIKKRSQYIRAMNFFVADSDRIQICSEFNEHPEYFQMQQTYFGQTQVICSKAFSMDQHSSWQPIDNHSTFDFPVNQPGVDPVK